MTTKAWQTHWHRHPGVRSGADLSFGERAADRMRNMMGSWPFVFSFFGVMIAWAMVNTLLFEHILHHKAFDPYPYILLNLFLSTQALPDLVLRGTECPVCGGAYFACEVCDERI